jgi:TetR/AcrR family transcriptional regulator
MALGSECRSRSNKFNRAPEKVPATHREFRGRPAAPFKQLVTQVTLHRLDLRTDRGLTDSQPLRRFAEITQLGDRHEYFELAKSKCHIPSLLRRAPHAALSMTAWQATHAAVIRPIASWLLVHQWYVLYLNLCIIKIMVNERKPARSRGRPKGPAEVQRNRLLLAAEQLLCDAQQDFSLRQVALHAAVTPPLAHYYFGNRDGLLRALVSQRAAPRINVLLTAARERSALPVSALTRLMQQLTFLCANDRFVRCCLLLPAGATLRATLRDTLREQLRGAQITGQLRADLSANYLADTLLGLCLFPFLDSGAENPGERAAELVLQHVSLLQDGIRPGAQRT